MGFSFKVAPGVRIRANSRGVRAGVGPRIARVHVGSGGVGVSTGIGPFGAYQHLSGSSRRSGSRYGRPGPTQADVQAAEVAERRAARMAQISAAGEALDRAINRHRQEFAAPQRPVIPRPAPPTQTEIKQQVKLWKDEAKQRSKGLSRPDRKSAMAAAEAAAVLHVHQQHIAKVAEAEESQRQVDAWWESLHRGDPATVLATVNDALSDNERPSACVSATANEVSVVVLAPTLERFPTEIPAMTAAGNRTLRRLSQTDRNAYYFESVLSHMMVTLKEVFAVAPTARSCRAVMVGLSDTGMGVLIAGVYSRSAIDSVDWQRADLMDVVLSAQELRYNRVGRTKELRPIIVSSDPDLQQLLDRLGEPQVDDIELAGEPASGDLTATQYPAGWYPDANQPQLQRYWDGQMWTEHTAPR